MNAPSEPGQITRRRSLQELAAGITAVMAGMASVSGRAAESATHGGVEVKPLLVQDLAGHDGEEVTLVELEFAPGATSERHRHPGPVFLYVTAGTVETQVEGGPLKRLRAGEVFYEAPGAVHAVARNPSLTEGAKAVAFLVAKKGAPVASPA